jgi:hypothetical protein
VEQPLVVFVLAVLVVAVPAPLLAELALEPGDEAQRVVLRRVALNWPPVGASARTAGDRKALSGATKPTNGPSAPFAGSLTESLLDALTSAKNSSESLSAKFTWPSSAWRSMSGRTFDRL